MIKLLKLVTDDEVVAEVLEENDSAYILKNAARFALTPQGLDLVPISLFLKGDTICIAKDKVVFEGEPDDEATNAYNERFGGLIVASAGLQLP